MNALSSEILQAYRQHTFRLQPGQHLRSAEDAVNYVNERGFVYFWPITGIVMPSLWTAVVGDRPVADAHDDPGHVTWGWKDGLLGQRRWYYAKVLRKKSTMISLESLPYFYALSENYGSPEDDYLTLYEQGRMTQESKLVYEALLDEGPLDTVALRRKVRLTSRESDGRFSRALTELQTDFKILPVGVAKAGGWNYAFIYEIAARHFPDLPDQAQAVGGDRVARRRLAELYFRTLGAAQIRDVTKLFGWTAQQSERTIHDLVETGFLRCDLELDGQPGEWVALAELC